MQLPVICYMGGGTCLAQVARIGFFSTPRVFVFPCPKAVGLNLKQIFQKTWRKSLKPLNKYGLMQSMDAIKEYTKLYTRTNIPSLRTGDVVQWDAVQWVENARLDAPQDAVLLVGVVPQNVALLAEDVA